MQLNPYLHFQGDCEAAFRFYEKATGGKILAMMTFAQTPMAGQTPPDLQGKIVHARMEVGGTILMGADAPHDRYQKPQGFSVILNVEEPAEADRVFHALAEGGGTTMPIQETFWARRFGMLVDKFGIPWMVNCEKPMG